MSDAPDMTHESWRKEMEQAFRARDAMFRRAKEAEAEVERLRAALEAVQWGSCDGCGQKSYCPECGTRDVIYKDGHYTPSVHEADCIVGLALRTTSDSHGGSGGNSGA